jgi:phosphohistidine phosphatase
MDLLVVRHSDAGDAKEFARTGQPDDLRPLSDKGRKQMQRAASALRRIVPQCDRVFSSPLKRAVETAEILCSAFGLPAPETTRTLIPGGDLRDFEQWAAGVGKSQCVAVVGHEPHLSTLVTWLMTATNESRIVMKKGGACLVEFAGPARAGEGELRWLLGPRELDLMAEAKESS